MFVSDKRLCLTKDGQVVEDGHPDAVSLLVGKGGTLSLEEAKRYGLLKAEKESKAQEPAENKAIEAAPANKAFDYPKKSGSARRK